MNDNRQAIRVNAKKNLANLRVSKLKIRMDLTTLDMVIAFLYKDSVLRTRKALTNIDKLFKSIDLSIYKPNDDIDILNRIWIITNTLDAKLREGFANDEIIMQYCKDREDCDDYKKSLIDVLVKKGQKITYEESKYLLKQIDDRLQFGYAITLKETIEELFSLIDPTDVKSYRAISEDLYQIANATISIKRKSNSLDAEQTFSLQEEVFQTVVSDALTRLKNRNRIFVTGIKYLNTILAPGYMGTRLYTYLAFPGGGKSQILLKAAVDIRKYNAGIQCENPDNRPAVLFITMENSIEETVERIFNMLASDDDIRNYTEKQVCRMLREQGELTLSDKNNIDIIIKYYPNRSIDTTDLYGIIQDLEDDNIEVVALILDYLKRIRPAEPASSEKEELKNITNELKTLANALRIPVITAQQLNRTASAIIDAAIQAKKEDVTKLVGRDGVAGAWEIIENSDVVIIINREKKLGGSDIYLTFKLLKRRYRSSDTDDMLRELEYFNHPYAPGSSIRLIDDIDMDTSVSLTSLASQFVAVDVDAGKRGKKNAIERDDKKKKREEEEEDDDVLGIPGSFEPFEMGKSNY